MERATVVGGGGGILAKNPGSYWVLIWYWAVARPRVICCTCRVHSGEMATVAVGIVRKNQESSQRISLRDRLVGGNPLGQSELCIMSTTLIPRSRNKVMTK